MRSSFLFLHYFLLLEFGARYVNGTATSVVVRPSNLNPIITLDTTKRRSCVESNHIVTHLPCRFLHWSTFASLLFSSVVTHKHKIGGDGWLRTNNARGGRFTVCWGYQFSYISKFGCLGWARTSDQMINSHLLYLLSYKAILLW